MLVVKDVVGFIKKPDDFVLKNSQKAVLYSIVFKIIGFATLIIRTYNPMAFFITSVCFFSASLFIDHKILKNIESLIFQVFDKLIRRDPEKLGFYIGRILYMYRDAEPLSRLLGIFKGYFFQRNL